MPERNDIERYANQPRLLMDLCRAVVAELKERNQVFNSEKAAQLRAISEAVEKLEQSNVPVPENLRSEKLRLAIMLNLNAGGFSTMPVAALRLLRSEFTQIRREVLAVLAPERTRNRANGDEDQGEDTENDRTLTPPSVLQPCLLETMREMSGSAQCNDILDRMEEKLEGKLLPGDLEHDDQHRLKWRHNVHWLRLKLKNEGIFRDDSPRGVWELSNDHH